MKKINLLKKVSFVIAAVSVSIAAMVSTGKVFYEAPGSHATINEARSKQAAQDGNPFLHGSDSQNHKSVVRQVSSTLELTCIIMNPFGNSCPF